MGDVGAHIDRHLIATLRDAAMLIEVSNTAQASVELARIAELQRRYHAARAAFNARVDAYPMGYGS